MKYFKNSSSLSELIKNIMFLVKRHGFLEQRSTIETSFRISPLGDRQDSLSNVISKLCQTENYSRFCCFQINKQLQSSITLGVLDNHFQINPNQPKPTISGKIRHIYGSLEDGFCLLYTSPSPRDA